ncbi:MAG: recombination mediator RecR [Spirochaetota bacterium]
MPPELLAAIEAIQSLPGIGRRSAMRIAFDFIRQGKPYTENFNHVISQLVECIAGCDRCGAYKSQAEPCPYCDNPRRNRETLCVVEHPSDIYAVENTGEFFGYYHVLGGVLSPLDGIGPNELKMPQLAERVRNLKLKEVIVAANPSVEGNATGHYIADMLKPAGVRVTRIATGLALGQMLDYAETQAITQSLKQRVEL